MATIVNNKIVGKEYELEDEEEGYIPPHKYVRSTKCFKCGHNIGDSYIYWMGMGEDNETNEIIMHPECTLKLITQLTRDVYAYECAARKDISFTDIK